MFQVKWLRLSLGDYLAGGYETDWSYDISLIRILQCKEGGVSINNANAIVYEGNRLSCCYVIKQEKGKRRLTKDNEW